MQGECFESALYSWRNMPRGESKSPVELLFGRKQRTALPTLARHHQQINIDAAAKKKDVTYERAKSTYNKGTTEHSKLQVGVLIFCLLYTSPSPRDLSTSRMPSSA